MFTPNELAHYLIGDNVVSLIIDGLKNNGSMIDLVHDTNFPLKNAPVEIYAKEFLATLGIFSQNLKMLL